MSQSLEKRTYTFAGNDADGRMRTILVDSVSPAAADKAAKQRLSNARMLSVSSKARFLKGVAL